METLKTFKDLRAAYKYSAGVQVIARHPDARNQPQPVRVPFLTVEQLKQRQERVLTRRQRLVEQLETLFAVEDVLQFLLRVVAETCACGKTAAHAAHDKLCCGHDQCCEYVRSLK